VKNCHNTQFILFFHVVVLSLLFALTAGAVEKKEQKIPVPESTPVVKQGKEKDLAAFIKYETAFFKSLVDLKQKVGKLVNPQNYHQQIAEIEKQVENLGWQVQMAKTDTNIPYEQLSVFDTKLDRQEQALKKINKPLTKNIQQLSNWLAEWSRKKKELAEWKKIVISDTTLGLILRNVEELNKTAAGALEIINSKLEPAIKTGQKISKLQVKTYGLIVANEELIGERREGGLQQTMPPVFSTAYLNLFTPHLFQIARERASEYFWTTKRALADHPIFLLLNFLGLLLLAATIYYMGRSTKPSDKCYSFTRKPVSVSIFFFLLSYLIFHIGLIGDLINLEPILQICLSFSVILLAPIFNWYSPGEIRLLRLFLLLLIISWFFRIISLPTPLMQLYIAIISFCMICYCFWRKRDLRKRKKSSMAITGLRLIIIFFIVSFAGMIFGYERFAFYIFSSVIIGVVAAHVVALIYLIVMAALELLFLRIPSKLVQTNSTSIVNRLSPIIGFMSGILYLFIVLKEWQIYPSRQAVAEGLLSLGFTAGGIKISPGSILLTAGIVYIILITSKAIQKILLNSIFPRYHMELGVQLSMARLIHYTVLVIGFVILLNILGFELTKLTIIGGALGVGIGFGLQAIVNNFASGLILLFERPIKVGDTIQIGENFGEIKKLGLRATIVNTFDNAEIVIPNSDLITAPVTNWTLTGRQARVKIPVGVAYGSDIQKVLEILMSCAEEHPLVMSQPRPKALFLAFGSSSLDLELRVWTPDFSDRRQLQSELNQEIESEFSIAGIEIPFPQSDLHLRSIDSQAAETLKGNGK